MRFSLLRRQRERDEIHMVVVTAITAIEVDVLTRSVVPVVIRVLVRRQ
jgi:hypothetical protein